MPGAQGRRVQELDPHHALKDLQDRGVVRVGVDRCISTAICSRQPKRAHKIRTVLIPTDRGRKIRSFPIYSRDTVTHSHGKPLLPTSVWAVEPRREQEHRAMAQEGPAWQIFVWVQISITSSRENNASSVYTR